MPNEKLGLLPWLAAFVVLASTPTFFIHYNTITLDVSLPWYTSLVLAFAFFVLIIPVRLCGGVHWFGQDVDAFGVVLDARTQHTYEYDSVRDSVVWVTRRYFFAGLLCGLQMGFMSYGLSWLPLGTFTMLEGTWMVFTVLYSKLAARREVHLLHVLSLCLHTTCVVLLAVYTTAHSRVSASQHTAALCCAVLSAACAAAEPFACDEFSVLMKVRKDFRTVIEALLFRGMWAFAVVALLGTAPGLLLGEPMSWPAIFSGLERDDVVVFAASSVGMALAIQSSTFIKLGKVNRRSGVWILAVSDLLRRLLAVVLAIEFFDEEFGTLEWVALSLLSAGHLAYSLGAFLQQQEADGRSDISRGLLLELPHDDLTSVGLKRVHLHTSDSEDSQDGADTYEDMRIPLAGESVSSSI